jgi:hypothetical protein
MHDTFGMENNGSWCSLGENYFHTHVTIYTMPNDGKSSRFPSQ